MTIAVLEFGGQYTDLIGNRLKEMGYDVAYLPSDVPFSELYGISAVILSGGPRSVYKSNTYPYDPEIFRQQRVPVLGICYGMQVVGKELDGNIYLGGREYGETRLVLKHRHPLFDGFSDEEIVWMNHGDSVRDNGDYDILAVTGKGIVGAIASRRGPYFGVQFHPEVTHTEKGKLLLRNFLQIAGVTSYDKGFDGGAFIEDKKYELQYTVGNNKVLLGLSGGVDSAVVAALVREAGVKLITSYIDTGFGRKGDIEHVQNVGRILGLNEVDIYDRRREEFVNRLAHFSNPKRKRLEFRALYREALEDVKRRLGITEKDFLAQGTLATDKRESGEEAGKGGMPDEGTVENIKDHHNVGISDLDPLKEITKDRVRIVARELGLPPEISERQPFPGPGLLIRFLTSYYAVKDELYTNIRDIASSHGLNGYVLPRKGVGLKGDNRVFQHVALLAGDRDWERIRLASKELIEELPVCRVLYLPTEERLDQNELKTAVQFPFDRNNLDLLREGTEIVEATMQEYGVVSSQTPVITFGGHDEPWLVIRDVQSEDFRTARPLRKPNEFPWECYDDIVKRIGESDDVRRYGRFGRVAFDVSDKPGGTVEME